MGNVYYRGKSNGSFLSVGNRSKSALLRNGVVFVSVDAASVSAGVEALYGPRLIALYYACKLLPNWLAYLKVWSGCCYLL